jgi:molybdopterin converting factor small subunit
VAVLRLREPLKRMAGDRAEHELAAETVGELLEALEREQPEVRGWILDERGELRRHINVYLNGEPSSPSAAVAEGDRVDVLPAISGGR